MYAVISGKVIMKVVWIVKQKIENKRNLFLKKPPQFNGEFKSGILVLVQ